MLQFLTGILSSVFGFLDGILPGSPFAEFFTVTSDMNLGIGWLNWFVPITSMAGVLTAWIAAAVVTTAIRVSARVSGGILGKVLDFGGTIGGALAGGE